ncbi:MAG TPA: protoporphyrinogen oxidase [Candidatus Binataceae bacterium]|jgi:oxygen-dependent protoporphyrinogen oxidase|nr:protoporphyrinogen oxidase [Candidatus Binataceae bacterium]
MAESGALRIVILGGGISGLSAAFRLLELSAKHEAPLEVALLEGGPRLGGALHTIREQGFIAEAGADSFLTEKPWALDLVRRLGLQGELVGTREEFRRTCVVRNGALVEIPEGFSLLAPARLLPMLRSPLLSPLGKARMAIEPLIPRRRGHSDESLASFVTRRLGRQVLERIAQPLAGGIYTADPEHLSLHATQPRFADMEARHGSVMRGLRAAARAHDAKSGKSGKLGGTSGARWSLFVSLRGGISTLIDALAQRLGETVRRGAEVVALELSGGGEAGDAERKPRWCVVVADGGRLEADAVICALPAHRAAPLLAPHSPGLARALGAIAYASAAVVNLAYREGDFPRAPRSFGFVVPAIERRRIIAGSFTSLKFSDRAPAGTILLRAFVGGALQNALMALGDPAMIDAVREEFRALLGVSAEPVWAQVNRWPDSMPQYAVGHRGRIAEIERAAVTLPAFELAGAMLRGVGIPDCVLGGERAAQAIFTQLGARPGAELRAAR